MNDAGTGGTGDFGFSGGCMATADQAEEVNARRSALAQWVGRPCIFLLSRDLRATKIGTQMDQSVIPPKVQACDH